MIFSVILLLTSVPNIDHTLYFMICRINSKFIQDVNWTCVRRIIDTKFLSCVQCVAISRNYCTLSEIVTSNFEIFGKFVCENDKWQEISPLMWMSWDPFFYVPSFSALWKWVPRKLFRPLASPNIIVFWYWNLWLDLWLSRHVVPYWQSFSD